MRERKYWAVGASFSETEDVSGEFLEKGIWYDGYADNGDKKDDHMLNQMNVGDYLIMKSSSTKGPGHKISFTKLKGIGEILEKEDYYSFKMKWYEIPDLPKDFDYISYRKTIEQLRDDDILEFTLYQIKLDEMKNYLNNIKSILEQKNQIILQGPPGTGKTYTAQDIAYQLIFGKELSHEKEERKKQLLELEKNNCYKFVQFHPSYTYEDFVRGITAKTNGQSIEYKAENKVLGKFAKEAYQNLLDSKKSIETISLEKWLWEKINGFQAFIEDELNKNNGKILITGLIYIYKTNEYGVRYQGETWKNDAGIPYSDLIEMYKANPKSPQDLMSLTKLSASAKWYSVYWLATFDLFKKYLSKEGTSPPPKSSIEEKKYVLIIDEINRANLPSVLGELIYALEYRDHHVQSMYELEIGGNEIIIPSNLYIIGTMNTADRSVGHIDYAIRRRFAFIPVPPNKSIITFPLAVEYFDEIKEIVKKYHANDFEEDDIMLGHSYFLANNNADLKMKLKYEVYPILKEYLKDGLFNKNDESDKALKDLHNKIEAINE